MADDKRRTDGPRTMIGGRTTERERERERERGGEREADCADNGNRESKAAADLIIQ